MKERRLLKVISADTDVFVLLCSMYLEKSWSAAEVYMQDFNSNTNVISIKKTVEKNKDIIPSLISLHALTGCDTGPQLFGIRKGKAHNVVKKIPLTSLGNEAADYDEFIEEGKRFVPQCYGLKEISSSKNRYVLLLFNFKLVKIKVNKCLQNGCQYQIQVSSDVNST